jgi:hypothetical protein
MLTPTDLQAIETRLEIARTVFGPGFDQGDEPDGSRAVVEILADRDREALLREVRRLSALLSSSARPE